MSVKYDQVIEAWTYTFGQRSFGVILEGEPAEPVAIASTKEARDLRRLLPGLPRRLGEWAVLAFAEGHISSLTVYKHVHGQTAFGLHFDQGGKSFSARLADAVNSMARVAGLESRVAANTPVDDVLTLTIRFFLALVAG